MIAQINKNYFLATKSRVLIRLLSYFLYEGRPVTTKGRWFNPLTFLYLKAAANAKHNVNAESPLFITGTGRSGSTILGMVLSVHRDVGFLNEPKAIWYLTNSSDDLIGSYSKSEASYCMNASDVSEIGSNLVKSIYSSFLSISGSKKIVDKFPEMIFRIEYLNTIFKHPKFLFLYRNPWDTISSTAEWSDQHTNKNKKEDWWGINNRKWKLLLQQVVSHDKMLAPYIDTIRELTSQQDKAAVEWIVTMNQGIQMMLLYPDQVLPVKYEELSSEPLKILNNICNFSGLKKDDRFLDFAMKTIHPVNRSSEVKVHPILMPVITSISKQLGYKVHSPSMSVIE
jgi:hypothetical protein